MEITRIGDHVLGWGESVVWDDRRQRLYMVDCAARTLHWLEGGGGRLHTRALPSMPAGVVPAGDGRLVVALDDGLALVDPDADPARVEPLAAYPEGLGARANDACADPEGNLITGTLNMGPAEGSTWWYSASAGWRLIDPAIANTNGPTAGVIDGAMTLIVGDSSADYFAYPYEPATGAVGERRVFGDTGDLAGVPDGATLDAEGGLWCALWGGASVVRFTAAGLDRTVPVPVANPTDVTFGGPGLDRLYVVSAAAGAPEGDGRVDGAVLVVDGLGVRGRPEPRFRLA